MYVQQHQSFVNLMIMVTWAVMFIATSRAAGRRSRSQHRPRKRLAGTGGTMRVRPRGEGR